MQIGKIIFRMLYSVCIRVLLINSHIIRKQAVAADVGKSDLLLYVSQLLLICLLYTSSAFLYKIAPNIGRMKLCGYHSGQ